MKKTFLPLLLIIVLCTSAFSQQKWIQDPRLMSMQGNEDKTTFEGPNYNSMNYVNPNTNINVVPVFDGVAIVYPNYRVHPSPYTQSEVPITSHFTNKNFMYGSCNWFKPPSFFSEGCYVTTNGGDSWFGSDTTNAAPLNDHVGDPAPAIDLNNRMYISYLQMNGGGGIYATNSTNYGATWANASLVTSASSDKNHTFIINNPASPYNGYTIVTWSNFALSAPNIQVVVTTNNGTSWSAPINVQTPPAGVYSQGVNGCQGPDGQAYMVWQSPNAGSPYTGKYCGFAKSTNGGFNWTANNNIFTCNGIRGNLTFGGNSIRVNDFPWMGCDLTSGPRRGWLYVVTAEKNLAPAGSDADIVFHRSTDGGTTWSPGIRVNKDAMNNGKFQYMPALCVGTDGSVNVVFYDNRNTPTNDSVQVIVARSLDGGDNWEEIVVSDHKFKPQAISGLASYYQGDYIGITEGPGMSMFPYWADNSSGLYQAWTAKVSFATYPLNAYNLTAPAPGTRISTFPNTATPFTFSWDTSASTASYKWTFYSPAGTPKLVVSTSSNNLTFTSGQLDNLLAGIGLNQGDSLVGNWNVMAYRNNLPQNDSLAAANGPRTLTLKRGKPLLTAFNLNAPTNGSTVITSVFNNGPVNFNWTKSGDGVKYKVKWGQTLTNLKIETFSNNSGFDTSWTVANNVLDLMLQNSGLAAGDSLVGQYAVYAYSGLDSLKSVSTFALTMKRQAKGDWLIAYDSTSSNSKISKDSVTYWMGYLGKTFDLYNRAGTSTSSSMSFRGYKGLFWVCANTSVMSVVQKDSIKSYLLSGGTTLDTKSKYIMFGEDSGWQLDRSGSTYYDSAFAHGMLGWVYLADYPGGSSGGRGIIGDMVNNGMVDSTMNTFPDYLQSSWRNADRLYKFRITTDATGNAFGLTTSPTYNAATFGTDIYALRNAVDSQPGSPIYRLISGAIYYVAPVPVELTSFTADVNKDQVSLHWVTATETNNSGFSVERNSGSGYQEVGFVRGKGTTTEMQSYIFTDKVKEGTYTYRLKQVDFDGTATYSKEIEVSTLTPTVYALDQNYPNPFNPSTVIRYSIPNDGLVTLQVFNILGERVMTLVNQNMKAGKYEVNFNASNLASGIYLYRLDSGNFTSVKKMMLVK